MAAAPRVCLLGLGKMGGGMARRLREQGHPLAVWNRTRAKADELCAEQAPAPCITADTAAAAVAATAPDGLVILVLSDTASVLSIVRDPAFAATLSGRTIVNLTSGSPDDGRECARAVAAASGGGARYIDGAYCGPPAKARAGAGQVFVSSDGEGPVDAWRDTLSALGAVAFCGKVGTSRAIDYAVVDLAFVNLLAFMSNAEMLQREGVDMQQFFAEAAKRAATIPAMLEMYHKRMASRDEADYAAAPTATLGTWHAFWGSRLPYFDANGMPGQLPRFAMGLLEAAGGGPGGAHQGADASRLQETVRYGAPAEMP
eukprot:TRINITY_DN360_c0_g1_i15.p2 TRINITY_DN360_c0_g1~~TRINITY_DN360_c0_g1_i15.p2  ORF type:complete len:342 (+),score=121.55 TRINITY_DN360_c0_g1_i15:82-1026(+)